MKMMRKLKNVAGRFHADEGGADLVEYILVIAAVALPLAAIMIWFRDEIAGWARETWDQVSSGEGTEPEAR